MVFHDMLADMMANTNLNRIVTESLIGGRKVNI